MVVKANSLIEASYKLSIDEVRILALTIGTLDTKSNQRVFDFTVAEFIKEFPETKDNAYRLIQRAIKKLYERSVRTEDSERITDFRWVSSKTYYKNEGRFRIALTDDVMPYLTQLKGQFTRYQLRNIAGFNSVHAIRIYELCIQHRANGRQREISVDNLKKWLQVEDKYAQFQDFKKRVIEPSIKEINEKSDILVSVEYLKKGRKVTDLLFSFSEKQAAQNAEFSAKTTKSGRPKLPQRPQVVVGSPEEAKWARRCIKVLKDWQVVLKQRGENLSQEDYEKLAGYYNTVGEVERAKKIRAKFEKPKEPKIIQLPSDPVARFNYLWQERNTNKNCWGLDRQGDSKIKLQELVELSQNDGISEFDRKQVQIALDMFLRKNPETGTDILADIPRNEFNPDDYDTSSAVSDEDEQRIKAQQTQADIMEALLKELISLRSEVAELKKEKS